MGGELNDVKTQGSAMLSSLSLSIPQVKFGVAEYKDVSDGPSLKYKLNTALPADAAGAQSGIDQWSASGGGDLPEGQLFALHQLAVGDSTVGWREGAKRIVVYVTARASARSLLLLGPERMHVASRSN
jgi:hypothetical protein